jgi:ADP-heptose:LPS heptosyltransferase
MPNDGNRAKDNARNRDREVLSLKRVVVLRALGGLGDFLCVVPALRSLRLALPKAEIVLVGLPTTKALAQRFSHYINKFLEFPGYPGLPEQTPQLGSILSFFAAAQAQQFAQQYDLAIQMHGSGTITNSLTVLLGAKRNAGFFLQDHYCPDPTSFLPYLANESEVRRYLRLLNFLGMPTQGEALEFPISSSDRNAGRALQAAHSLHLSGCDRYICIHPGASSIDKQWSPQSFAIVADAIAQMGFQVVLTGSLEELPLAQSVANAMQHKAINLAGCTSLGSLAVLLKASRLLICNDTGISHLVDALQVPSVVIFTHSDINRWAPLDSILHRAMSNPTPTAVIDQSKDLLQLPILLAPTPLIELGRQL